MSNGTVRWRKFLQSPRSGVDSYVVIDVPKDRDQSILLKIADCDRRVALWFPHRTKTHMKTSRAKLAVLREAVDRLEQVFDILEEGRE